MIRTHGTTTLQGNTSRLVNRITNIKYRYTTIKITNHGEPNTILRSVPRTLIQGITRVRSRIRPFRLNRGFGTLPNRTLFNLKRRRPTKIPLQTYRLIFIIPYRNRRTRTRLVRPTRRPRTTLTTNAFLSNRRPTSLSHHDVPTSIHHHMRQDGFFQMYHRSTLRLISLFRHYRRQIHSKHLVARVSRYYGTLRRVITFLWFFGISVRVILHRTLKPTHVFNFTRLTRNVTIRVPSFRSIFSSLFLLRRLRRFL